ncbi:hypothetical protein CHUAL_009516 [Chamberlinius hualienensis]
MGGRVGREEGGLPPLLTLHYHLTLQSLHKYLFNLLLPPSSSRRPSEHFTLHCACVCGGLWELGGSSTIQLFRFQLICISNGINTDDMKHTSNIKYLRRGVTN